MLQEKCCRDITSTLQRTLARSYLQEFASRLNVDIRDEKQPDKNVQQVTEVQPEEPVSFAAETDQQEGGPPRAADTKSKKSVSPAQTQSQFEPQRSTTALRQSVLTQQAKKTGNDGVIDGSARKTVAEPAARGVEDHK